MKVLITGGAGFIGSFICEAAIKEGNSVVVVDDLSTGNQKFVHPSAAFYQMDIRSNDLEWVFQQEKPDIVIHQAAQVSVSKSQKGPMFDASTNVLGTVNLLFQSAKHNVQKFIYASSAAVYGNPASFPIREMDELSPLSFYGLSKLTGEAYVKQFHDRFQLPYTILRYSNVYGMRQSMQGEAGVISLFIDRLLKKQSPVVYGSGEQTRDFVFVKDVAKANIMAMRGGDNEILNISTGTECSINQLVSMLKPYKPSALEVRYVSPKDGDIYRSCLDSTKAFTMLNWKAESTFEQGLERTIKYFFE
ncbi:NAD-dependent epimerase/dehydratase family protein [Priestia abyssalis]|uniref:NAD-dependent epimerase/dehydratase family protein n=1 Tax=Priestia abyssalis TaxID=1221450 RepID=UPI0009950E29|nr:NAD-dependent epimerase/dehydratase family protein [Priestia abyssalis]